MSESPQNAEIEDVLSSIRRLVAGSESASRRAEDDVSEAQSASASPPSPSRVSGSESDPLAPPEGATPPKNAAPALVLTPDDRVDPAQGVEGSEAEQQADARTTSAGDDAAVTEWGRSTPADGLFRAASARGAQPLDGTAGALSPTGSVDAEERSRMESPRQGFGFGGARRDDPVKHIPLASRPQADTAADDGPIASKTAQPPVAASSLQPNAPERASGADNAASATWTEAAGTPRIRAGAAPPDTVTDASPEWPPEPAEETGTTAPPEAESAVAPPDRHRRVGPIISEAFAHPPEERIVSPAEPTCQAEEAQPTDPDASAGGHAPGEIAGPQGHATSDRDAEDAADASERVSDPDGVSASEAGAPDLDRLKTDDVADAAPTPASCSPDFQAARETAADLHERSAAPVNDASPSLEETMTAKERESHHGAYDASTHTRVVNLFSESFDPVDPALLRGLVRDVLREELDGEIGRKASARIRALIRHEVQQALAERSDR